MKLMKLYYLTLEELKDLPDKYGMKILKNLILTFRVQVPKSRIDKVQDESC